jgi:hypothetical protein
MRSPVARTACSQLRDAGRAHGRMTRRRLLEFLRLYSREIDELSAP